MSGSNNTIATQTPTTPTIKQRVGTISESTVTYPWNDPSVHDAKAYLMLVAVAELLIMIPIYVAWGLGYIPSFPMDMLHFAGIYYITYPCIAIVDIVLAKTTSKVIFAFGFFLNFAAFLLTCFLESIILYQLITCWIGQQPLSCRDDQLIEILFLIGTSFLLILTFIAFAANITVLGKVSSSSSIIERIYTISNYIGVGGGGGGTTRGGVGVTGMYNIPQPMVNGTIWDEPYMQSSKFLLVFMGVAEFLFILPIYFFWAFHVIPSLPIDILHYGAIYYISFLPIWLVNIFLAENKSRLIFQVAFFLNSFIFLLTTFLEVIMLYQIITCTIGQQPQSCADTLIWDVVMAILNSILWIITLVAFCATLNIVGFLRRVRKGIPIPKKIN